MMFLQRGERALFDDTNSDVAIAAERASQIKVKILLVNKITTYIASLGVCVMGVHRGE